MILSNLPVIQVLIPLFAAFMCALSPCRKTSWALACVASGASFICAVMLAGQVYANGTLLYVMGGWAVPFGIEYRIDSLATLFLMLISGVGFLASIYAFPSVQKEIAAPQQKYFYSVYLLLLVGLFGVVATNDIFNMYVFLEVSSLATYALVAMGKDRRALVAAFEYLVLGTIGAIFILFGIGLLYSVTGTLNLSDNNALLQPLLSSVPVKMAIAFLTIGLALKIAIFPLHIWLTNAYTHAPSFVSAFISATSVKVGIYLLVRLMFFMFGKEFIFTALPLGQILIFLGLAGVMVGSVVAIMQDNIKRMLAYSSIAQVGLVLVAIGLANQQGLYAAMLLVLFHAIAKSSMFMASGAVLYSVKGVRAENFAGIGRCMPLTMSVFIIGGLSMVGVPGTAGFIAKWYLLQATIAAGMWPVFAAVLVSSFLTLIYIWRVIEIAFFRHIDGSKGQVREAPIMMLVPMFVLAALSVILGIYPEYVFVHVTKIIGVLFG